MQRIFTRLYAPSNRGFYLAVFRVYLALHLFKDILFRWTSLDILYGVNSFVARKNLVLSSFIEMEVLQANYHWIVFAYMIVLILFAFGIGKHVTAALLYLLVMTLHKMHPYILDGGDNILEFFLLYMVFCNSYEYLSISKLKLKSETSRALSNMLTNLGVLSILGHLCLVYFVTGLHKAHADAWFDGVATYYILSLERFMGTRFNAELVQNGYFVTITTYASMLWELSFAFLVWKKRWRPYVLLSGVMMHLGIYVFMMINDFQILFIMAYGFFFSDEAFRTAKRVLPSKLKRFRRFFVKRSSRAEKPEYAAPIHEVSGP